MFWVLRILGEFDELLTILRSKRSTRIAKKKVRGRVSSSSISTLPYYYYHIFAVRPLRATLKKSLPVRASIFPVHENGFDRSHRRM